MPVHPNCTPVQHKPMHLSVTELLPQEELRHRQAQLQAALDAQQRQQAEVQDLRGLLQQYQHLDQQVQHKSVSARTSFEVGRAGVCVCMCFNDCACVLVCEGGAVCALSLGE